MEKFVGKFISRNKLFDEKKDENLYFNELGMKIMLLLRRIVGDNGKIPNKEKEKIKFLEETGRHVNDTSSRSNDFIVSFWPYFA